MLNLQRFEIKGHKGSEYYALTRDDLKDDYDIYPDSEFVTIGQWEEFREKSSFPYWLPFGEVITELVNEFAPDAGEVVEDDDLVKLIDSNEELAEEIRYNN